MVRVLFLTTGLMTGGAEQMLWKLLSRLHGRAIEAVVVSLLDRGQIAAPIESLGIEVHTLDVNRFPARFLALGKLRQLATVFRPQVIQGWMYHGNLAAVVAQRMAPGDAAIAWGIRQSLYDLKHEKLGTRLAIRLGARLSRNIDAIIYNSETSRFQHEAFGFSGRRKSVLDNGFDTELFKPDLAARAVVRSELGLPQSVKLVGLVARYHPMKGHENFLHAANILAMRFEDVNFVVVGRGVERTNAVFGRHIALGNSRIHLLGERADISRLTAALDVAVSASSWGEGFANVLGEAMSCEVPCVTTDVGDARRIVGETGYVVPPGSPVALAEAIARILEMSTEERRMLGQRSRARIIEKFSIENVVRQYESLYATLAS